MTFRELVYQETKKIPKGKVATYGQLARLVGRPKAARAVGIFMRTNPFAPIVPCHRVVAADGSLNGYFGLRKLPQKKQMLLKEGVVFAGEKVDLAKSLWQTALV
jgi:O-6-methylguanine DNA methyltransferase